MTTKNHHTSLESLQENAKTCFREGRFEDTLINLHKILEITTEQPSVNTIFRSRILSNVGIVQVKKECFNEALNSFQEALAILKSLDNAFGEAQQWGNIGSVHRDLREYERAISNYEKALSLYKKNGHQTEAADQFTNIAYAYAMNRQKDKAVEMYRKAATIYDELQDKEKSALAIKNIKALDKMS